MDWNQATSLTCWFQYGASGPKPLCGVQHMETLMFHKHNYKLESMLSAAGPAASLTHVQTSESLTTFKSCLKTRLFAVSYIH